ncbi:MAG: UDP-N-acetylglucosamine 2-epimerase (non-hydrolyzing) [Patescibacteria group bacterium]
MQRFLLLVGARPNFIKIAPIYKALKDRRAELKLVHTGQHYDSAMSEIFFRELGIPDPDFNLNVGSGERQEMTKKIVDGLLPILRSGNFDCLVTVGDVTSTAAGAMAGIVAGVPVVHVEAGLRSFNWRMPEELNRMIADHYSKLLFVSEPSGLKHLADEKVMGQVHYVGNVMIDTLRRMEKLADETDILSKLKLEARKYGVVTLHRPENVDDPAVLPQLWGSLEQAAQKIPLVFPVHPRTTAKLAALGLKGSADFKLIEPIGYIDMLALEKNAACILTDSGGLQEEATALGVPCLTLRTETERPSTVTHGTNEIVGHDRAALLAALDKILAGNWKAAQLPELWDGHAAERIAEILISEDVKNSP